MRVLSVTPTITGGAYTADECIGGLQTINYRHLSGFSGSLMIQSVIVTDNALQDIEIDCVFFDDDPSNSTFTDNSAFTVADADMEKIIGVANITTYKDFADNSVGQVQNLAIPIGQDDGHQFWVACLVRGAPTYVATNDLTFRFGVLVT